MKKLLFIILTCVFGICLNAQDNNTIENHVITFILKDKSEVLGYPNVKSNIVSYTYPNFSYYSNSDFGQALRKEYLFYYYDSEGKVNEISLSKIDSISVTDSSFYFVQLPDEAYYWSKVAESDNYILYDEGTMFKIYDKQSKEFLKIKLCGHSSDGKMFCKRDAKTFEERIQPYFKDCTEFIDLVKENLKEEKYDITVVGQTGGNKLFKGIANLQCK